MSDSGMVPYPQVFVVDGKASCVTVPTLKKARWSGMGQKVLLLLMGLAMLGLVVQASLIYSLYRKVEAFSHCMSHPFCQNQSSPKTPGQQGGTLSLVGSKDHNDVSTVEAPLEQKRPFAQLTGSSTHAGENNVVQWEYKRDDTSLHHMGYSKGRLLVQMEGHYYLYSKLTWNAAEECSLVQHKVMKVTKAYDQPIELMKSKSIRCATNPKNTAPKPPASEDLRNSFLAGIFHLQRGDEIYVTLDEIRKLLRGPTDNMGAFMIAP